MCKRILPSKHFIFPIFPIIPYFSIGFISQLDDVAFHLAKHGRFGPAIENETTKIEKTLLPKCVYQKYKHTRYILTVVVTGIILVGLGSTVLYFQNNKDVWTTKELRIQFEEKTGLQAYNGCYEIDEESNGWHHRYAYKNSDKDRDNTTIGYCSEDQRWVLFKDSDNNSTPTPCSNDGEIVRSSKTNTYDISTSFDGAWYSSSGIPVALYFFDNDVEPNCGKYFNDGICDSSFNNLDYQFDEGDCCVATCTQPSCGFEGLASVFGNANISGDGYSNCIDPSMVPVTIRLDNIYSNHNDTIALPWNDLLDDDTMNPSYIEELIQDHLNKEPVSPLLFLDCNGKNVISVFVDKTMENANETVMIEDGANCTMTVQKSAGDSEYLWNIEPTIHINYTIFHGDEASIAQNPVVIISGQSSVQNTINFRVVPNCYFEKLMDYFDNTTMYTGTSPTNEAIDWLMDDKSGNSQCENPYFIERYALGVMSFSFPISQSILPTFDGAETVFVMDNISSSVQNSTIITIPWLSSERQCVWQQVVCKEESVVSLTLISTEEFSFEGSIATEIGLLTNLEILFLRTF